MFRGNQLTDPFQEEAEAIRALQTVACYMNYFCRPPTQNIPLHLNILIHLNRYLEAKLTSNVTVQSQAKSLFELETARLPPLIPYISASAIVLEKLDFLIEQIPQSAIQILQDGRICQEQHSNFHMNGKNFNLYSSLIFFHHMWRLQSEALMGRMSFLRRISPRNDMITFFIRILESQIDVLARQNRG